MVEIVWSRIAEDQLRRAIQYIQAEQGAFYANLVLHKIFDSIEHLADFPKSGPVNHCFGTKGVNTGMLWPGATK